MKKTAAFTVLLFAALAAVFVFGACSSDSESAPDPEYCGTYTNTPEFLKYLKGQLGDAGEFLTSVTLEIKANNTLTVTAMSIPINGTYTYNAGIFRFDLDDSTIEGLGPFASIAGPFENGTVTYSAGILSTDINGESMNLFTK